MFAFHVSVAFALPGVASSPVGAAGGTFGWGTALTIFGTDRHEDMVALALSLIIALLVYLFI